MFTKAQDTSLAARCWLPLRREIVLGNECQYREWYNPNPQHAFFREQDYIARVRWASPAGGEGVERGL